MADVIDNNAKQPSSGTGFTNLQRVLNANQNNRLGSTINSGVSNVVGQANTNLNQAQNQFSDQSKKGTVGTDQDKQYVSNTLADPTKAQQTDYDQFAKFRQGYTGPKGLQSDTLQGQQQELNSLGGLTQSSGGRQALLQRFVGSPQYNQGQQRLDTTLLGQTGGNNLNQLRRQTQQANQNINQGFDTASNQANLLKNQSAGFGQDVTNQLTGVQTAQNTDLTNRAAQYTTEEQALHDMLSNFLSPVKKVDTPSGGNVGIGLANQETGPNAISQAQYDQAMAALGRSGQAGQDLLGQQFYGASAIKGFDPETIIGKVNPYSTSQVATAQDLAKAQALSKLQGETTPTGLASLSADKLGGYDPLSFLNNANLKNYENQGKGIYDSAQGTIKSGEDYMADINKVKDIAKQQADLINQGLELKRQQQNYVQSPESFLSPEQQSQLNALTQQRADLVNKQSLVMLPYGRELANYIPSETGASPEYQSRFDQGAAAGIGNAMTSIGQQKPIIQKYNSSTIGDRLKALLAKTDTNGNTVQG